MHKWEYPHGNYHAREFHVGWVGIDGDTLVEQERQVEIFAPDDGAVPKFSLEDLTPDVGIALKELARGVAGMPMLSTPALKGASRAHIECEVNVDSLGTYHTNGVACG
jgi:hypothetical protein